MSTTLSSNDVYGIMFEDYSDVMNPDKKCEFLGVSTKSDYKQYTKQ